MLVDAPCSCEANFLVDDPRSFSYWSKRKVKECQRKQKRLLFSGLKCLKPGGLLVYSTCTFSPQENEEVINWLLNRFKDEISLEQVKLSITNVKDGLTSWEDKTFSQSLKLTKRILPTKIMEGFYIAKIRKVKS